MVITVVLAGAAIVVLAGGATELWMSVRDRRQAPSSQDEALQQLRREMKPGGFLTWTGAAALAVFTPVLLLGSNLSARDVALVIIALGFAGERAGYLVAMWPTCTGSNRDALALVLSTGIVAVGGLVVGLTA